MYELTYHPNLQTNDYDLGVITENGLVYMYSQTSKDFNRDFLFLMDKIVSFRVVLESGSATMRLERMYWYAYKKVKGRLNKAYVGRVEDFTEDLLIGIVRQVNVAKVGKSIKVTQKTCVTDESAPVVPGVSLELAGHQKNANHLQTNLIPQDELSALKATLAMNQNDYTVLHEQCRQAQRDRLAIIEENKELKSKIEWLNIDVEVSQDKLKKVQKDLEFASVNVKRWENGCREEERRVVNLRERIFDLEKQIKFVAGKKRDNAIMSNDYLRRHDAIVSTLKKYRELAKGKDKRNHPFSS